MTTITTNTHYSPAVFKADIQLPPPPAREHPDSATALLLQHASGVSVGDLPAPQQIAFNSAIQFRLDELSSGYLPQVRKVLAECDAIQDDVMIRRREREADAQNKAWEYGHKATLENDKASELQRNAKFVTSAGQIAGGIGDGYAGGKGIVNKAAAGRAGDKAAGHEKAVTDENKLLDQDAKDVTQLEGRIETLKSSRTGDPAKDVRVDMEIATTHIELGQAKKSVASRTKVIEDQTQAASKARQTERAKQNNDAELALGRGMSACLNGAAGVVGAQIEHDGDLKKNEAQRLQLLRDQEEQDGRRAGSGADEALSNRGKINDAGNELIHLERPASPV